VCEMFFFFSATGSSHTSPSKQLNHCNFTRFPNEL